MLAAHRHRVRILVGSAGLGLLMMGSGQTRTTFAQPPALEGPVVGEPDRVPAANSASSLAHDALRDPARPAARLRAPKSPPAPIAETATNDRPNELAQWVPGYWAWDAERDDFTWVSGLWQVPPRGLIWIGGRWARDDQGWYRLPGFWSARQTRTALKPRMQVPPPNPDDLSPAPGAIRTEPATPPSPPPPGLTSTVGGPAPSWKQSGPPAPLAEQPGPAPGPDAFFVAGHYVPKGNNLAWKPGYWARPRAGFEWIPARWVRKADGWAFREGKWAAETAADAEISPIDRGANADQGVPTDPNGLPPAIVDSQPAAGGAEPGRDVIGDAENPAAPGDLTVPRVMDPNAPRVVRRTMPVPYGGPVYVVPYPYGPRYYDPLGVVPPFARRIIDRFAP